jgi:hypothetical protein
VTNSAAKKPANYRGESQLVNCTPKVGAAIKR